ncbi:hypothetical protein VHUM_03451 [Vanrija humicola]|uniref:HD/PDEase domain-containing protein n=1 Tax=Vanrija humicola TaxID=5417 RepID=A0A7D8YY36_VANHU|nr:hypothetical protein VHUM_03451 [Vanrija humicola]
MTTAPATTSTAAPTKPTTATATPAAPDLPLAHLAPATTAVRTGHFQTLRPTPTGVQVIDEIHGTWSLTEPVLVALLSDAALRRLAGVHQHGVTGLVGLTPPVTRLEHSLGALLLVRRVGGSLEEQVAALLHDVSHTVLSHVVDAAFPRGPRGSFHEDNKARYVATTGLPALLERFGYDSSDAGVLNEEAYPLVERPAPRLCADRLDYGLRDAVAFGALSLGSARAVVADLLAFPSATAPDRVLALQDAELALALARAYGQCDATVWANPAHVVMYARTGGLMKAMVDSRRVDEAELWSLSDHEFWAALRARAGEEERALLDSLESEVPQGDGLSQRTKIRTLDPDVVVAGAGAVAPLSVVRPEWAEERGEYIRRREAERR